MKTVEAARSVWAPVWVVIDGSDRILRKVWSDHYGRRMVAYGASIAIQPSTFIRRNAFLRCAGFNVENRDSWDGELLAALYLSGARIAVIEEFLSGYRLHAESITNSGRLADRMKQSAERRFRMLMGRDRQKHDRWLGLMLRAYKHLSRPEAFAERLLRGPVFARHVEAQPAEASGHSLWRTRPL